MNTRNLVAVLSAGFLIAACGGASDSTGTSVDDLNAHASHPAADAGGGGAASSAHGNDDAGHAGGGAQGNGKSCKPVDGGRSPCAKGHGEDGDDGGGDDQGEDQGGRGDAGKKD